MYHILIAGAGYTGERIAGFFAAKKQKVYALTRSSAKASGLEAQGIHPLVMDLTQPATLERLPPAHFVVIAVAPDVRDELNYRRVYLEGVRHLLEALRKNPRPSLVVYLSSSAVWGEQDGAWVDENIPPAPDTERGRILLQAEQQVLDSGFPAVIFRLAGIYGPGRTRLAVLDKGAPAAPEKPRWMNMIHVEDIVSAMPVLFKQAREGTIYAGADDEPVSSSYFYGWLARQTGKPQPFSFTADPPAGKRIRNTGLKGMGFTFQHPTFREGYRAILANRALSHRSK